ncbi:hypothetical protein F7725_027870 [Dissostichus mawsoni]|uniref:Uncharacterized protein n=1 Tax=Dissostichus mawsoni TaxID=36200 RepID=A0A7J5XE72_DISMA|nr:hypothetical protein F7725_027870 [Dissostichus mawsoni]
MGKCLHNTLNIFPWDLQMQFLFTIAFSLSPPFQFLIFVIVFTQSSFNYIFSSLNNSISMAPKYFNK